MDDMRFGSGGLVRILIVVVASIAVTGCLEQGGGGGSVRSHSTSRAVYDMHSTPAVYHFAQVVSGTVGTVTVRVENPNAYCIRPAFDIRLQIGAVDMMTSGAAPASIPPGSISTAHTFSFIPRVDYAAITILSDNFALPC